MIDDKYWGLVLNSVPVPTVVLKADSPAYSVVFVNQAYVSLCNLSAQEISGKSFPGLFSSYYPKGETAAVLDQLLKQKNVHKRSAVKYNLPASQLKGSIFKYVDIVDTPLLTADGEVEFIIHTLTDVTDLVITRNNEKTIYENLARHEKFLSESQRIANIGNWEVDMVNNTIEWSDVLRDIYEVGPEYHPTFESSLTFYKDDTNRQLLLNAVDAAVKENGVFDVELEIITAGGKHRWLRSTGKPEIKDGTFVRLYGVTQDITQSKNAEKALADSSNQYRALIESVDGVVWEADANTFEFTYISNKVFNLLGYTPAQWLGDPNFWAEHIYQDDRDWAVNYCISQTSKALDHIFDYRMIKADGSLVWIKDLVSVIEENGKAKILRGVMIDYTEAKLLASLDNLEKNVLELIADKGATLHKVLDTYMLGIENLLPNMRCSLLQVDNGRVYNLAAPSLPGEYIDAINGLEIGEKTGSCGTAAYRKKNVVVADIATDPLWENYKHLALKHGLRSCWSYPIINSDNEVIAVFGMYYNETKPSGAMEKLVIERAAAILKVILENRHRAQAIEEATMLIAQGQELANFGNWQWDIKKNIVKWSDVLYSIYGIDKKDHKATFEGYLALLHHDDREPIQNIILGALHSHHDVVFEERIIRPDGELRYLRSWGRVLCNAQGQPEKMIGSCLDITTAKIAESSLLDIAWMQSHLVRAPLVRLMGLIELLKEEQASGTVDGQLFNYIMSTACELDNVVKDISGKTSIKV